MSNSNLSIGIIGLPNVGKSTLFNALLKRRQALVANYPFATVEPNVGIVAVPDKRLDKLAFLVKQEYGQRSDKEVPEKIVPAVVKFYDIAGLVAGAHKGEGLGNKFLAHIREVDAILHVVRVFSNENVTKAGSVDPIYDIEVINTELLLADLQTLEKQKTDIKTNSSKEEHYKVDAVKKLKAGLNEGKLAKDVLLTNEELLCSKSLNLLTLKPILYLFNVQDPLDNVNIKGYENSVIVSAKTEFELSQLNDNEKTYFMNEYGLSESGLDSVINLGFRVLGLQTFLTAGVKEVKAWTIKMGTKAPQAAGVIHGDFERGFIGADIISCNELIKIGSWRKARDAGFIRMEGKNYVMKDGDVVEFRFNI